MCGFAGFWNVRGAASPDAMRALVMAMADTLRHRGPDDGAAWVDADAGVALGFRRLAILDLSAEGRQPMASASGRYVCVFNGEIYNFLSEAGAREMLPSSESSADLAQLHNELDTVPRQVR